MTTPIIEDLQTEPRERPNVVVHVNGRPVPVLGPTATGLEIKRAAIAAGLAIQLDFVLSLEEEQGHTRIIGDADPVHLTEHSRFLAVAPDDNS